MVVPLKTLKNNKYGKHMHDHIMSRRAKVLAHKNSLTSPLCIEMTEPGQKSERSCSCVLVVSSLSLSTNLLLEKSCTVYVCYGISVVFTIV